MLYRVRSAAASISLVLVLPLVPVMATTGPVIASRRARASAPKARNGVGHLEQIETRHRGVPLRTTAATAPAAAAAARKSWASNRSPASATNSAPAAMARVSVEIVLKVRSVAPAGSFSAARTADSLHGGIATPP